MQFVFLESTGNVPDFNPGPFYDIAYPLHSILRYVLLGLMVWAIMLASKGRKTDGLAGTLKRPAMLTMIAFDIQFLLAIYLWVVNFFHVAGYKKGADDGFLGMFTNVKRTLKVPTERAILFEHSLIMLIALVLIHIGYAKFKRAANDQQKSKRIFTFYTAALVLVVLGIVYVMISAERGLLPAL
jgi:uncharacterized membrane protein